MATTAKQVHELQEDLDEAREAAHELYEAVSYEVCPAGTHDHDAVMRNAQVREAKAFEQRLAERVALAQAAIGGKVYRVVGEKLDDLTAKVEKLNRRAAKLGVEPVELRVTDERDYEERPIGEMVNGMRRRLTVEWTYVVLRGGAPKLDGWMFVASLDHDTGVENDAGEQAAIISRIPASSFAMRYMSDMPEERAAELLAAVDLTAFRYGASRCDHCNAVRRRNKTYVVVHEFDGRMMQVGSTCVRDFLGGTDPHALARFAELLFALDEEIREQEEIGESYSGGSVVYDVADFAGVAAALIRRCGYERSSSNGGTAAMTKAAMWKGSVEFSRWETVTLAELVTDEDRALVADALRWVREDLAPAPADDFQHNLATLVTAGWSAAKHAGLIAYLPVAWKKEMERREEAKLAAESQYFGEIGERYELELRVIGVREYSGHYGVTYITKLVDGEGRRFLWWAPRKLDEGATYRMRATVKQQGPDEYAGGVKTTTLGNPRGVEQIAEAVA